MSLEYLALCDGFTSSHHRTMERLFQAISAATSDQSRARAAAILIQRHWRGYRDRAYINFLHWCALRIQCCYRAHIGRIRFRHHQQHYLEQQQHAYYHIQATLIQKIFRGYYSRKYAQDFHQRKAYIRTVQQKGEDLHQRMETTYQQQVRDSIMARQHSDEAQFTHLTENIHHLISTKAIPGVFGPKMGMGEESKTMAYEKPMEDHIKDAFVNRQQRLKTLRESMVLPARHRPTSDDLSHSHSQSQSLPHSSTLPSSSSSSSRHNPRGSSIRAVLENGRREISNTSTRSKWDQSSPLTTSTSTSRPFMASASATSLLSHTIPVEEKEDVHYEKEMNGTSTRVYPTSVGPVQIRRKWAHPIGSPLNGLTKGATTTLPSQPHPPSQPHRPSKPRTRPQSQPQPQLAQ